MSNNRARVTGRTTTRNMAGNGETIFKPIVPPRSSLRKFTEEQVREIRASDLSNRALADQHGVTIACIRAVRKGLNYAWVI